MTTVTESERAQCVPCEVLEFARANGIHDRLPAIMDAARLAFDDASVCVYLEADPELAEERRIILEVNVDARTVDELAAAEDRFEQLCQIGPTAGVVCLRLRQNQ